MLLVVGITGASGVIYGIRLLEVLSANKAVETHLVVSKAGAQNIKYETDWKLKQVTALADFYYDIDDTGAALASGSFKIDGMIVAPCSMKTLSAVANSYTDNLLTRTADVTLKERRKLILLVRETPLHLGHLTNMEKVTEMGAVVLPPIPAFYHRPRTIQEVVDHTIGKVLDILDIEHNLFPRWSGTAGEKSTPTK